MTSWMSLLIEGSLLGVLVVISLVDVVREYVSYVYHIYLRVILRMDCLIGAGVGAKRWTWMM